MKRITLIIVFLLVAIQVFAQFPESFETSVPPTDWASFIGTNGKGTSENWQSTSDSSSGTAAAYVQYENVTPGPDAQDWLVTPLFTPTSAANILSFAQKQSFTPEYGSVYTIRVSTGSSQTTRSDFAIIDTQAESDFSTIYDMHYVDLSAYNDTPIYVAFVMTNDDGDDWYIDDVDLISSGSVPNCISNGVPNDTAVDVDIVDGYISISWDAPATGDPAQNYEIFWGTTSGSLNSLGSLISTSVFITNIDYATTYYWMVVPINYAGSAIGCSELSFTTEGAPANDDCINAIVVNAVPFNETVDAGGATNNSGFINDCSPGMNDGVWYTFTPDSNGTIDISVTNVIGWDPELSLYSGTCGSFVCEANIDDGIDDEDETLSLVDVLAGTQYWINIGYWSNSTNESEGTFDINIDGNVGIALKTEDNNLDGFAIYPNPVNSILQLNAQETIDEVSIYNLLGQEIFRTQPRTIVTQVDMTDLPTGMYVVKVQVGEQLGSYRIVKE